MKKTVVIGASEKPDRVSNQVVHRLAEQGMEVIAIGVKEGKIGAIPILTERPAIQDVHTVSLYVGPQNQTGWYDYIVSLNPDRIIFNPGTENDEFENMAKEKGIKTERSCTLVLLSTGQF